MSGDFSCRCLVLTITYKEVNPRGERRARNQIRCRVYSRLIVRLITRVILRWFIAMKSRVSECVSRIKRDRLAERRTSPPFDISKELPASFSPMFYAENPRLTSQSNDVWMARDVKIQLSSFDAERSVTIVLGEKPPLSGHGRWRSDDRFSRTREFS